VPLGHLNPPNHTQPSDHVYLLLPGYQDGASDRYPVYAPSDATVVRLRRNVNVEPDRSWTDYQFIMDLCGEYQMKFGHLTGISASIEALTVGTPDRCNTYGYEGHSYENCSWEGRVAIAEGEQVGTAGGYDTPNSALDVWGFDWSGTPISLINSSPFSSDMLRITCPLDWFNDDLRTHLYDIRRNFHGMNADLGVGCGKVFQDVPGTAKGFWYLQGGASGDWQDQLALVDDNVRSTHQVVSVASTITSDGYWVFTRSSEGSTNRDFTDVVVGSGLHCYHLFTEDSSKTGEAADLFLIEMVDTSTLRIEWQTGSCNTNPNFTSPHTYVR